MACKNRKEWRSIIPTTTDFSCVNLWLHGLVLDKHVVKFVLYNSTNWLRNVIIRLSIVHYIFTFSSFGAHCFIARRYNSLGSLGTSEQKKKGASSDHTDVSE